MHNAYTAHLHAPRAQVPLGGRRHRRHRRQRLARNSTCSPIPAKTPSRSPTATTTPPTSRWPWRCRRPRRAPRQPSRCAEVATPGATHHRATSRSCSNYPPRSWSRPCWSTAPKAAWSRCWCAAITSSTRSRRRSSPGVAEAAAHVVERHASRKAHGRGARLSRPGRASRARIYADHSVVALADFVCGANKKDAHLTGVNWGRDLPEADRRRPAQRGRRATPALRARARCASRAASKWATSSSSARSTASPWAPRCSTNPARRPRCTWAATASV